MNIRQIQDDENCHKKIKKPHIVSYYILKICQKQGSLFEKKNKEKMIFNNTLVMLMPGREKYFNVNNLVVKINLKT